MAPLIRGHNLTPSENSLASSYVDDTPKGAARILNSLKVRQDYHEKKKIQAAGGETTKKGKRKQDATKNGLPKIIPGESLGDFNRRLEDHMRPVVTQAMKDANAKKAEEERKLAMEKKARREAQQEAKRRKDAGLPQTEKGQTVEAEATSSKKDSSSKRTRDDEPEGEDESKTRKRGKTEFEKAPTRHSILDVMTAPPVLPRLKKQVKATPSSIFAPIGRNPFNAGQQRLLEEERERVVARYRELKEKQRFEKEKEMESLKTKKR
jgi:hypothetical protein